MHIAFARGIVTVVDGKPAQGAERGFVFLEREHPAAFQFIPFGFGLVADDAPMGTTLADNGSSRLPTSESFQADAELAAGAQFLD